MFDQTGWYSKAFLDESTRNHQFYGFSAYPYEDLSQEQRAVFRLWCAAASEVKIKHPHPNVHVFHHIMPNYDGTCIRQACWNLPDNDDHEKPAGGKRTTWYGPSFGMRSTVNTWPGYEPARLYLLAQWSVLQLHESFENVWYEKVDWRKKPYEDRVACPHYGDRELRGHQQDMLDRIDSGNMQRAISIILGEEPTRIILERNKRQAERELQNEIAADSFD